MKAVIMAGGRGTRLGPYTAILPKPLVPLGDMPVLELLLRQLKRSGVTDVILAVNHLHHLLRAFFGEGEDLGLKITYSLEDRPLGTAGPLAAVIDQLSDDFIVANGDLLTTLDFTELQRDHAASGAGVTVASFSRELKIEFGLLETNSEMRLQAYREKPSMRRLVSMGMYMMKRDAVAKYLKPSTYLDIPDLLRAMMDDGQFIRCHAPDCFWLDIGRPDDYDAAQRMFETDRTLFLPDVP